MRRRCIEGAPDAAAVRQRHEIQHAPTRAKPAPASAASIAAILPLTPSLALTITSGGAEGGPKRQNEW